MVDSSWLTDHAARALRLYIGPPGTVIPLLRTARWISPLRIRSPWFLFDSLVLYAPLPTEVLPNAAVLQVPVMYVAPLCAAPLPWCGTSPGPKFMAESQVRWSSVIPCITRHSRSARQVFTLSWSHFGLQTLSFSILGLQTLSFSILGLQTLLFSQVDVQTLFLGVYLVSGRPSVVAAAKICAELFNSSHISDFFNSM